MILHQSTRLTQQPPCQTTMAASVVRDMVVRKAFTRIAWVSVGQTPSLSDLQRVLYQQLTGEPMPTKDGANAATQLEELQAVCKGQRWLIVLDDVSTLALMRRMGSFARARCYIWQADVALAI